MACQSQQSDALQVLAEQEAWKTAKQHGLDLVTILPNFVLGPVLSSRADGTSVGFLKVRALPNLCICARNGPHVIPSPMQQ